MASAANLLVGPGNLHTGDFGTTEPVDTAVADPLVAADWPDAGATDGGVSVTVAKDYVALRMDQTTETPGRRVTKVDVTLKTALAEVTLENWALALSDAASAVTVGVGYAAMDIGGPDEPGAEPTYLAAIFRGRAPQGRRRLVIARKVLSVDEVSTEYKKADQTFIPVTFACHWVSQSIKSVHCVDERPA